MTWDPNSIGKTGKSKVYDSFDWYCFYPLPNVSSWWKLGSFHVGTPMTNSKFTPLLTGNNSTSCSLIK